LISKVFYRDLDIGMLLVEAFERRLQRLMRLTFQLQMVRLAGLRECRTGCKQCNRSGRTESLKRIENPPFSIAVP
jgi:hypothetical protein